MCIGQYVYDVYHSSEESFKNATHTGMDLLQTHTHTQTHNLPGEDIIQLR